MHDPANRTSDMSSLFVVPVRDQVLLYAPLHGLAALVNRAAAWRLKEGLLERGSVDKLMDDERLQEVAAILREPPLPPPLPRQGDLDPAFLGLLPTRGCNFACRYCGFLVPDPDHGAMGLELARDAVDWYMGLMARAGRREVEIHYFGGEPFCAPEVLDLTVHLARMRAAQAGCTVRFEVATNGAFSDERCRWAADNLDTIVLSLDGPADIQNDHRPYRDGRGSFERVARSAGIMSEGATHLFFRACVTDRTVGRMAEIAAWFCQEFHPQGVCFEPVQPAAEGGGQASARGPFVPPDPWAFARHFIRAAEIVEAYGVEAVYASAGIRARRVSFCPVGRDGVIVSPDGSLSACYLLPQDWEARGLDLSLGCIDGDGTVHLDAERLAFVRSLNVWNKPFCDQCFCKWHCAGGCHVHHALPLGAGGTSSDRQIRDMSGDLAWAAYDRLCIQTRAIALRNVLETMGRRELVHALLDDDAALERAILQASDRLADLEDGR